MTRGLLRKRALSVPLLGDGRALGATLTSIAASGTAAATTFVVAWGIGAEAFGHFTVVLTIALLVGVAMLASLHFVMYQELPRARVEDRPALMATALGCTLALATAVTVTGLAGAPLWTRLLGVDTRTLAFGLALAFAMTVNQLTESLLRGLRRFTFIATLKLVTALAYLAVSTVMLLAGRVRDADAYLVALIGMYIVGAMVAYVAAGVSPRTWSSPLARTLLRHGAHVTVVIALTTAAFGLDVILLNHWASAADVGVYSVYNGFPKRLLGVVFTEGVGLVLLPTLAVMDKPALMRRLRRLAPAVGLAAAALSLGASAVFLLVLRHEYPYSLGFMALAAVGIGAHTVFNLYFFAVSMDGVRGARLLIGALAAALPVAVAAQVAIIAWLGLVGGLISFIVTNAVLLGVVAAVTGRAYRPSLRASEVT